MVANAKLYIEPHVLIGTSDVSCHLKKVTLLSEVFRRADIETYCNPGGEAPSGVRWTGVLEVRMSYGADSAWEFFSGLDATEPQEVTIYPGTATAPSTDNPEASFDAYIDPIGFIPDHEVGGSGTFELAFTVVGEPNFATSA